MTVTMTGFVRFLWRTFSSRETIAQNVLLDALEEKCMLKINNELIMKSHKAKLNKKCIWFLWMMSAYVSFHESLSQIIKVGHSDEVSLNDTSIFSWPLLIFTVCYPRMMWMLGNGSIKYWISWSVALGICPNMFN